MTLLEIQSKFPSARQETDGSITFECFICASEGHIGKRLKLYTNGALSCSRYASAGTEANSEHCHPIYEILGLRNNNQQTKSISEKLFDGKLTLECSPYGCRKVKIVARNCNSVLHKDIIDINRAEHRAKFTKALNLADDKASEVISKLINLADRFDKVQSVYENKKASNKAEIVSFKELDDGRIIEQIDGGFAIYDPSTKSVSYAQQVELDGVVYQPISSAFIREGGLNLAKELIEYYDEDRLDAEIEDYIHRNLDLQPRDLKLAAHYVRFSYIYDKVLELPYLRPIGHRGNGKSRFATVVGGICYRPVTVISPSAASLFRIVDSYHPTLIVDEANFQNGSDDTVALMQILNAGYQKVGKIPRIEKESGEMQPRLFDPFGCKIIASLKLSDSQAFESRCIQIPMSVTSRQDIKFRLNMQILHEQTILRGKLTLWRLRNWKRDFEKLLDAAEEELKRSNIEPRYVQIATPLYALITSSQLKGEFAEMLQGRDNADALERRDSLDGELMAAIHELLFLTDDKQNIEIRSVEGVSSPKEGELCELVPLSSIVEGINKDLPEKKKYDEKWVGKQLRKIGLQTGIVQRRSSKHYKKRVLIYSNAPLCRLFKLFSLAIPVNFDARNVRIDISNNQINELTCEHQNLDNPLEESDVRSLNACKENKLQDCEHCEQEKIAEENETNDFEVEISNMGVSKLVALDTETERFNPKLGIDERTTRMIGLSLSYDGIQAHYETDSNSWPFLMPEPEQTVIFHNAKFDLRMLSKANLQKLENWEDTFIAAHLLDENSEHGLKALATNILGIETPMLFEEAERMQLIAPEVFSEYACNDAKYTFQLWKKLEPEIDNQDLRRVYQLEKALVPVVIAMEDKGILLDVKKLSVLAEEVNQEIEKTKQEIYAYAEGTFDINSPQKTAIILYDKLNLPAKKATNEGHRSVSKEALEEIRGHHPIVDTILRYREFDKLANTFINVLPTFADKSGRIHPHFHPLGAKTGRFSCTNPNVQQIPARSELGKKLRSAFIAGEGRKLVVADYSQMELRVLAHYSKDFLLLEAYKSANEVDLHTLTASKMFKKTIPSVSKEERSIAKMINFGIAYGITPIGLFNRLVPAGINVSQNECKRFIEEYFQTYSGVNRFLSEVAKVVRKRGYVRNFYGRRRRLNGKTSREIRQAQNFIIQATAADLAKDAMISLHKALPQNAHIIGQVHDELIVECDESQVGEVQSLMVEIMQTVPAGFTVPMVVDSKVGDHWGECK